MIKALFLSLPGLVVAWNSEANFAQRECHAHDNKRNTDAGPDVRIDISTERPYP